MLESITVLFLCGKYPDDIELSKTVENARKFEYVNPLMFLVLKAGRNKFNAEEPFSSDPFSTKDINELAPLLIAPSYAIQRAVVACRKHHLITPVTTRKRYALTTLGVEAFDSLDRVVQLARVRQ